MGKANERDYTIRPNSGEVRGLLEVINIVTDGPSFQSWLENRQDFDIHTIAPGYLVFLETAIRRFAGVCESNPAIELESDYISDRAIRQLPELSAVPHASEKLNFCRAVEDTQKRLRNIGQPSSISDLFSGVQEVLCPFHELRKVVQKDTAPVSPSLDTSQLDKDLAILSLYTYFQQARKNRPHGYDPSNFDSWLDGGLRKNAITGYTVTLQFAWSRLLSPNKYTEAAIDELTQSERWTSRFVTLFDGTPDEEAEISLSDFRVQVEEVTINPIVDKYDEYAAIGDVYPDDLIKVTNNSDLKKHFKKLFSKEPTRDLADLSPNDRVAYGLIWSNQAEWISASVSSKYWMAETVLRGLAQTYSTFEEEVPIHVSRFNHKTDQAETVTYAILQRVPQKTLGDPSVWFIFDRFAVNSQTEGQARIDKFEDIINKVSEKNPVERIEVNVERRKFIECVSGDLTDDYLKLQRANENLQTAIDTTRGVVTELAAVYVLSRRIDDAKIYWSTKDHGEEIDVLVQSDQYVKVIECKVDMKSTSTDDLIDQLTRKTDVIELAGRDLQVEVWVWEQPSDQKESVLNEFGIDVTCLKEAEEIMEVNTGRIDDVFEMFYPEDSYGSPFSPPKRSDW